MRYLTRDELRLVLAHIERHAPHWCAAVLMRAIIGHSTPQMTHHDSHVDKNEKRTAATRAFDVVTGGKG